MRTLNNLDNILTSLVNNQFNLRPIFLIKIDSLEVYYDIKYEGMYVLKLKTNSNFLKENQYILDYFVNYADIDYYIKNNYLNNIMFVEKEIINEIDNIKKYILSNCISFKEVLEKLNITNDLYLELTLEAYSLRLEKPNLKYNVINEQLDLYDSDILVSSRYNILRK